MPDVNLENDSWGYKNLNPTKSFQALQCCQDSVAESLIVVTPGVQTSFKRRGGAYCRGGYKDVTGHGCRVLESVPDRSSSRGVGDLGFELRISESGHTGTKMWTPRFIGLKPSYKFSSPKIKTLNLDLRNSQRT